MYLHALMISLAQKEILTVYLVICKISYYRCGQTLNYTFLLLHSNKLQYHISFKVFSNQIILFTKISNLMLSCKKVSSSI